MLRLVVTSGTPVFQRAGIAILCLLTPLVGASAAPGDVPHDPAKVWPYLESLSHDDRLKVETEQAAQEPGLTIYGATGIDRAAFWIKEFNARYPNLKAQFVRLTETDLVQKVTAEARAQDTQADLIFETSTYLPLLEKTLAPFTAADAQQIDKRFAYGGPSQGWTAYAYEVYPESIAWRTDRLAEKDIPKTLDALAASSLANRLGTTPNFTRLATGLTLTYGEDGAKALLQRLATLNSKVYASHAALSDALAAGEIDFAWDLIASRPLALKNKGAPVDWQLMDPLYGESNCVAILKTTKSPYAAALFLDVMLSKDADEASDKWEGGRVYPNTAGTYSMSLSSYPNLKIFPIVDTSAMKMWQAFGEKLFIRRN